MGPLQNKVNGEDEYGVDWVQGWSDARVYRGLHHFPAAHLTQAHVHLNSIYSYSIEANLKHKWTQFVLEKYLKNLPFRGKWGPNCQIAKQVGAAGLC